MATLAGIACLDIFWSFATTSLVIKVNKTKENNFNNFPILFDTISSLFRKSKKA